MILNMGVGLSKAALPPVFTASGTEGTDWIYTEDRASNGSVNWELVFLNNVEFYFDRVGPVDIFIVGGGASGTNGSGGSTNVYGGAGGAGGECVVVSNAAAKESYLYMTELGSGDIDTNLVHTDGGYGPLGRTAPDAGGSTPTREVLYTARSGYGSSGGTGAHINGGSKTGSTSGSDGVYAFGDLTDAGLTYPGRKYGAGGGGAYCRSSDYSKAFGDYLGGVTGGGDGGHDATGSTSSMSGAAGMDYTGAGGGGACRDAVTTKAGTPGAGGRGIVIFRNAR